MAIEKYGYANGMEITAKVAKGQRFSKKGAEQDFIKMMKNGANAVYSKQEMENNQLKDCLMLLQSELKDIMQYNFDIIRKNAPNTPQVYK